MNAVKENAGRVESSRELLIKGGHVVTVDEALGDLRDGDVLIRDGVIAGVGRGLSTSTKDAEVIDATGRLVIPGLVDTHRHVWQGAIGAFTPQMTGAGYDPVVLNGISTQYGRPPLSWTPRLARECARSEPWRNGSDGSLRTSSKRMR